MPSRRTFGLGHDAGRAGAANALIALVPLDHGVRHVRRSGLERQHEADGKLATDARAAVKDALMLQF